jgi:hypothetical protein
MIDSRKPSLAHGLCRRRNSAYIAIHQHNARAPSLELFRNRAPNPLRGPGNDNSHAREVLLDIADIFSFIQLLLVSCGTSRTSASAQKANSHGSHETNRD